MIERLATMGLCLLSLGACLAAAPANKPIEGTVLRVTDGDSLWFEPAAGGAPLELRLQDIDAPEICQAWGAEARQALSELVLKKAVSLRLGSLDVHGRTLGTLYLDALDVNRTMVQEGHAWSTRYKYDRGRYVADERMAKALSRGFNREGGAVPPAEFRRTHGPCETAQPAQSAAVAAPTANAVLAGSTTAGVSYRCDGRSYCSQMSSCAEATFFLNNCPGVKMDGNRDGVPCEKQWCRVSR